MRGILAVAISSVGWLSVRVHSRPSATRGSIHHLNDLILKSIMTTSTNLVRVHPSKQETSCFDWWLTSWDQALAEGVGFWVLSCSNFQDCLCFTEQCTWIADSLQNLSRCDHCSVESDCGKLDSRSKMWSEAHAFCHLASVMPSLRKAWLVFCAILSALADLQPVYHSQPIEDDTICMAPGQEGNMVAVSCEFLPVVLQLVGSVLQLFHERDPQLWVFVKLSDLPVLP